MKRQRYLWIVMSLLFWSVTDAAIARQSKENLQGADGNATLVVTEVSGPGEAKHREKIGVAFEIENRGDADSGPFKVSVYLTKDRTVAPAGNDRLLGEEIFPSGLATGASTQATVEVLIPNSVLSGEYYYGVKVASVSQDGSLPISVTDETFERSVLQSTVPVVVEFMALWSPPCKIMDPILAELAKDYAGKLVVAKANVDENPEGVGKFGIQSVPTILFVANGQIVHKEARVLPKPVLRELVQKSFGLELPKLESGRERSARYVTGATVAGSVSSDPVSFDRFTLGSDGTTVMDHQTGLMWQRVDDGIVKHWWQAQDYCKNLRLAGYTKWRVPTVNELEGIVDRSRRDPAIHPVFTCRSADERGYWSSTRYGENPTSVGAWRVFFYDGRVNVALMNVPHGVRCVRDPS